MKKHMYDLTKFLSRQVLQRCCEMIVNQLNDMGNLV